jgi:hypothetical protein
MQFEYSTTTPWFLFNDETFGFDADKLVQDFWENGKLIIRNSESELILDAMRDLLIKIVNTSVQYQDEKIKNPPMRFQIILNGTILEIFLTKAEVLHLIRNSDSKWLFNGTYETGTDFTGQSGRKIEAKVYRSEESMAAKIEEANNGNRYIFHDADFVCCFLITTKRFINNHPYHYQWLKRVNGKYEVYNDAKLDSLMRQEFPEKLPLCRCTENSSTGEWELVPFYK